MRKVKGVLDVHDSVLSRLFVWTVYIFPGVSPAEAPQPSLTHKDEKRKKKQAKEEAKQLQMRKKIKKFLAVSIVVNICKWDCYQSNWQLPYLLTFQTQGEFSQADEDQVFECAMEQRKMRKEEKKRRKKQQKGETVPVCWDIM